jgi:Fe-S cluster assembly protein SufD
MTTSANTPPITEETIRELSRRNNEPEWLLQRRLDAWRAFTAMAMPNPLEEEWRRTDISGLDVDAALAGFGTTPDVPAPRELAMTDGVEGLVFQDDGATVREYASLNLPQSVVFADLRSAAAASQAVEEHLHGLVHPSEWKLQALQAALWQGGAFVYVPRGVEVELPLRYVSSFNGSLLLPHLLVVAEEDSAVTIVQDDVSPDGDRQSLVSVAVEIYARPNARVHYVGLQRWGNAAYSFSTVRARIERGARLTASLVGLGSRLAKTRLEVLLEGEGASAELLGLTFGDGNRHFDYNTLQEHVAPHTSSDLLFKAALTGRASEVWYGKVRIQKGASQSEANQTSRNLLLSDKAKAAPIPVLEIEAYDVLRCSHGATAGPLDEEQRFYLESRGIPPAETERMLVEAFFNEVLDRIPVESVRESVAATLIERLEASR